MNRYILIRRLRWPAILLLLGVVALLHEMGAIDHFMKTFIPLLLILIGCLLLAERAALAAEGDVPPPQFGSPFAGVPDPAVSAAGPYPQPTSSAIVPAPAHDLEKYNEGGQS
jgi:hypothetical protein